MDRDFDTVGAQSRDPTSSMPRSTSFGCSRLKVEKLSTRPQGSSRLTSAKSAVFDLVHEDSSLVGAAVLPTVASNRPILLFHSVKHCFVF